MEWKEVWAEAIGAAERDVGAHVPDAVRFVKGIAAARESRLLLLLEAMADGALDQEAIEAHSTKRGVIEGAAAGRRWDTGVLVPGIEVELPEAPVPVPAGGIVLRLKEPHMTGRLVRDVQKALVAKGFNAGGVDGAFGPQTAAAVRAFQLRKGLAVDGEVGALTARALGIAWY